MSENHDWSERVVLVAGATGAVGSALVDGLVARGARLAVAVRKKWQVDRVRERLSGDSHLVATVGSRDPEAASGLIKGAEDALGPIDGFVTTAGAFEFATVGTESAGRDAELFEANLFSTHNLLRPLLPRLRRRGEGRLVFTGARAVLEPDPGMGMALYRAAKSALHSYATTLAAELEEHGIEVTVVAPGVIDTEANREAMPEADRSDWTSIDDVVASLVEGLVGSGSDGSLHVLNPGQA